ncbi:uncharacterized protein [Panulirus ornatus]|uniref:uncharacterized protein n=1 Tax=Panulirus ornatus TaxID=150431 RepID=UPI003A8B78E3
MGWRSAFSLLMCVSSVWAHDASSLSGLHDHTTTGQDGVNNIDHGQASFNFSHEVKQPMYGNFYGHMSRREGDRVSGRYYVLLPDQRLMTVSYYADATGYHPSVSYSPIQLTGMFQDFKFGAEAKGGWAPTVSGGGVSSTVPSLLSTFATQKPLDTRPDSSVAASVVVPANGIPQSPGTSAPTNPLTLRPGGTSVLTNQLSPRPVGVTTPPAGNVSPKPTMAGYVYTAPTTTPAEATSARSFSTTARLRGTAARPTPRMTTVPPRATTFRPIVTVARPAAASTARPTVTTTRARATTVRPRVDITPPSVSIELPWVTTTRARPSTIARPTTTTRRPLAASAGVPTPRPGGQSPPVAGSTTAPLAIPVGPPPDTYLPPARGGIPIAFPTVASNGAARKGFSFGRRFNTNVFGRRITNTSKTSDASGDNGNSGNMNTFGHRINSDKHEGTRTSSTNGVNNSNGSKRNNVNGVTTKNNNNGKSNRNGRPNGKNISDANARTINGVNKNGNGRNSNRNSTVGNTVAKDTIIKKDNGDLKESYNPRQPTGNELAQTSLGDDHSVKDFLLNNGLSNFEFKKINPKTPATTSSSSTNVVLPTTSRRTKFAAATTRTPFINLSATGTSALNFPATKSVIRNPTTTKPSAQSLPKSPSSTGRLRTTKTLVTSTETPVTAPSSLRLTTDTLTTQSLFRRLTTTPRRVTPTTTAPFFFSGVTNRATTRASVRSTSQAPSGSTMEHEYDKEAGPAYIPVPGLTGLVAGAPVPQGRSLQQTSRHSPKGKSAPQRPASSSAAAKTLKSQPVAVMTLKPQPVTAMTLKPQPVTAMTPKPQPVTATTLKPLPVAATTLKPLSVAATTFNPWSIAGTTLKLSSVPFKSAELSPFFKFFGKRI